MPFEVLQVAREAVREHRVVAHGMRRQAGQCHAAAELDGLGAGRRWRLLGDGQRQPKGRGREATAGPTDGHASAMSTMLRSNAN